MECQKNVLIVPKGGGGWLVKGRRGTRKETGGKQ